MINRQRVVSFGVDRLSKAGVLEAVEQLAVRRQSSYVCVANVHMVMEAFDDEDFRSVVSDADLVVPDGMPLVWVMRMAGVKGQQRVRGPDLMPQLCGLAVERRLKVGFIGGREDVLKSLCAKLRQDFDGIEIVYAYSPPFRSLSEDEKSEIIANINESGANILFVGLGCPKQERWMASHRGRVSAVMLGVGAAFDLYSGAIRQCPLWLQRVGLEWVYRLKEEPRRLAGRYFKHNPRFVWLAARQLLGL